MKARTKFPKTVPCKACNGSGHIEEERDIIPCKHCGHDVHYEHHIDHGWTHTPGYGWDAYLLCMIDDCDCSQKIDDEDGFRREWPHP